MNALKPVYLMAGGRGSNARATSRIFKSILKETGKENPRIAYVGVASGDNWGFYLMISGMIKAAAKCRMERIVIATKKADLEKAKASLQAADAIFMSGGDVEAGMQVLADKNLTEFFQDLYRQGYLYFSASAGSIMLAREWVRWKDPDNDASAELFPCLGMAPLICDTHAEEDNWEELKAALALREPGTPGYGIPSGSCLKVYPDGNLEALGGAVCRYVRKESGVEKGEEILPASAS